jgi:hypothetical protein
MLLQMARTSALTLALALLAVACSSAAADCLAQYAGCTNCVNITLTAGHRRLLHGGRGRGGAPGQNRSESAGGHQEGSHGDGGMRAADGSFTTCTECNTVGYVLVTETRGSTTLGRCGEWLWPSKQHIMWHSHICMQPRCPASPASPLTLLRPLCLKQTYIVPGQSCQLRLMMLLIPAVACRVRGWLGSPVHQRHHGQPGVSPPPPRQLHLRGLQPDRPSAPDQQQWRQPDLQQRHMVSCAERV